MSVTKVCVVVLLAAALGVREARACSCMAPGYTTFLAPADGAVDVPLNTLVWVGAGATRQAPDAAVTLVDPAGLRLETTRRTLEGGSNRLEVFTPQSVLEPRTTYVVELQVEGSAEPLGAFTTGDAVDDVPPSPPVDTERNAVSDDGVSLFGGVSSCGEHHSVTLKLQANAPVIVATFDQEESGLGDGPEGTVALLSLNDIAHFGAGMCSYNWPEAKPGASTPAFLGAFDLAGNFSGWAEIEPLEIPWYAGCQCSQASVSLLALLGLMLRRRRAV